MMRSYMAAGVSAVVGLGAAAAGQVSIISGFEATSNWSPLLLNTPSANATIVLSGGNPGGYADLRAVLNASTAGGAGFYQTFPFFTLGGATPLTDVVLSADYRWFSGPTVTLVPFLYQQGLLYLPTSSIPLGTSTAWTSVGPMTFPLSSFSNSTGTPLNFVGLTQAGFMALIRSETPMTAAGRVGIDNLNLQVIPAPGTVVVLLSVAAGIARRRARAGMD